MDKAIGEIIRDYHTKQTESPEWILPVFQHVDQIKSLYEDRIAELENEMVALHRERRGEVWYWQGDGEDHVESLTCPILIEPSDFIARIAEAVKEERERIFALIKEYPSKYGGADSIGELVDDPEFWQALTKEQGGTS